MNFNMAFDRLIGIEGGYVNDPNDPGGETNWGISKRSYPEIDIKNLTREQAREIYLRDFWNVIGADEMSEALAFAAFDFAVNSGIQTSIRYLQRAVGVVDDGYWGPVTRAAAASMPQLELCVFFLADRLDFMRKSSKWPRFGSGWAGRIAQGLRYAVQDAHTDREHLSTYPIQFVSDGI